MTNQQLRFMPSVQRQSGTDVHGFISMQGASKTQTGHGRGLLNAKDSICSVTGTLEWIIWDSV